MPFVIGAFDEDVHRLAPREVVDIGSGDEHPLRLVRVRRAPRDLLGRSVFVDDLGAVAVGVVDVAETSTLLPLDGIGADKEHSDLFHVSQGRREDVVAELARGLQIALGVALREYPGQLLVGRHAEDDAPIVRGQGAERIELGSDMVAVSAIRRARASLPAARPPLLERRELLRPVQA